MTAQKKILLIAFGLLLSYCLGVRGFYVYLKGLNTGTCVLPSALYYALQMLFLNAPSFGEKMPLSYMIGRSLSGVIFALISGRVAYVLLHKEITNLRLIFMKNHLVICGLGDIGLSIADQAQEKGAKPVVIIDTYNEPMIKNLSKKGIPVIVGKPTEIKVLEQAKAAKAKNVMVFCDDDDMNTNIAYQLNNLKMENRKGEKIECILFWKSIGLLAAMQGVNIFPHNDPEFKVTIRSLNTYAFCARIAFGKLTYKHLSLHEHSAKQSRLIIIGFGQMGQSMAIQAAKIAHFPCGGKLKIHVVDEYAKKRMDQIRNNYPNLHLVADLEGITGPFEDYDVRSHVIEIHQTAERAGELIATVICHDGEDSENLVQALRLSKAMQHSSAPILVYQTSGIGFTQLMPNRSGNHDARQHLIPFGMIEEILTYEAIKDEKQDRLAKAIHEIYLEGFADQLKQPKFPKKPSQVPWRQLDETFREANRSSADHIPVKLAAMTLKSCPINDVSRDRLVRQLDESHIETMSKMEHARWCAERWLSGWEYGPVRDDAARIHPDLVEWDQLEDKTQRIDAQLIKNIHIALEKVQEGIVRDV